MIQVCVNTKNSIRDIKLTWIISKRCYHWDLFNWFNSLNFS